MTERSHGDAGYGDDETERIRAEIRERRERMGETLEQLGARLNPTVLKEQVKDEVKQNIEEAKQNLKQATIGRVETMTRKAAKRVEAGQVSLMERIRENPAPAAMIAIGLGWLILGKSSRAQDRDDRYDYSDDDYTAFDAPRAASRPGFAAVPAGSVGARTGEYYGGAYQGEPLDDMGHGLSARDQHVGGVSSSRGVTDDVRERASQAADRVRSIADTATSRAKEFTESASHRARDLADTASLRARDLADTASTRARTLADRASTQASQVADTVKSSVTSGAERASAATKQGARKAQESYQESPLALGAVAMALGVAAGLAIPVSDREVQLMGDARDQVVDRARDMARETVDKVEAVAGRVFDESRDIAKQAAREEGLTG